MSPWSARLSASEIWHHFGGFCDEGDTYDTQLDQFTEELDRFWAGLAGPDEHLRRSILQPLQAIRPEWRTVTVFSSGMATIRYADTSVKTLRPPERDADPMQSSRP